MDTGPQLPGPQAPRPRAVSGKAGALTESVIREMTRLALAHDAINLAQGFPDGADAMTDSSVLGRGDDVAAARALVAEARVAAVPGSSFYSRPELGATRLRFSFSKRLETLHEAGARLAAWAAAGGADGHRAAPRPT